MAREIRTRLTAREGRRFGLVVGTAFLVLALVTLWRGRTTVATVFGAIGAALILTGLLIPTQLGPIQAGWMKAAHMISRVTTPLFLGIVYFLVFTPIGLFKRLVSGNPLRHADNDGSYWIDRSPGQRTSDLERQF